MLLNDEELEALVTECDKLVLDKDYKSPMAYIAFSRMIEELIRVLRYKKYPQEVRERLALDAILLCYTKIPRYNEAKANKARIDRGLTINHAKSVYRYCEIVMISSFYNTFEKINRKQAVMVSLDSLGNRLEVGQPYTVELAAIEHRDIDAEIDAETVAKREIEFCKKLDLAERLNANVKKNKRSRKCN